MHKLIEKENQLLSYKGEDRVVSIREIKEELAKQKDPMIIKSGFSSVDYWIDGGFEMGEYILVSGITGQGKTTLCRSLSYNFAKQGHTSLWFSYEEIYRDFVKRMKDGFIVYMPMKLTDKKLSWIEERIWESKLKHDTRAVFIDHLHFLTDGIAMKQPSLEIGGIIRRITEIAKEHHVVIFLISHLTKTDYEIEIDMDKIRDSSFISQEAHKVFMVWRRRNEDKEYTNEATIKICKDRRSGTMGKKIHLIHQDHLYYERERDHDGANG